MSLRDLIQQADAPDAKPHPIARSLADLLKNPEPTVPPVAVVPRLVWPGRLTVLAGREKMGKSTLLRYACARTSRGAEVFGRPTDATPVLYVGLEKHLGDLVAGMLRFDADPTRVFIADALRNGAADLGAAITEHGARVAVLDSLAAFASGTVGNAADSAQWTPLLLSIVAVARETGAGSSPWPTPTRPTTSTATPAPSGPARTC